MTQMTKDEILRIAERADGKVSKAEIGAMLDLFEADTQNRFDVVDVFSQIRLLIARNDNSSPTTVRMHVIAQKYLANLMKVPAKFRDVIPAIYADEVGYYSVRNDQAMALHYANEVLDRESVPDVIYSHVLGLAIDSLLKLGMFERARKYVERLEVFVESHTLPARESFMMYSNLAYGFGFVKDRAKFLEYSTRVSEFDTSDLPQWLVYFSDLYLLGSLAVLDAEGEPTDETDEFAARYKRLISDRTDNRYELYSTYLIDQAFLLIPIFQRAWDTVGADEVMENIELLMKHSGSVSEKADYYSWFFDTMKGDRVRFAAQFEKYLDVMREYRRQSDENHVQEVEDEILRHDFEDKFRRQATIDPLTGLLNRFVYETEIDELRAMATLPENLHVVMADLNNLKVTNDTLGHQVGDDLIRGMASCLGSAFGRLGRVFRTGGDEFIALVYCDGTALAKAGEALRNCAEEWHGESVGKLCFSVGYASVADEGARGKSILQLLRLAEERMYAEKNRFYSLPGNDRRKH